MRFKFKTLAASLFILTFALPLQAEEPQLLATGVDQEIGHMQLFSDIDNKLCGYRLYAKALKGGLTRDGCWSYDESKENVYIEWLGKDKVIKSYGIDDFELSREMQEHIQKQLEALK